MIAAARRRLAPNGVLRAGINMSNILLVTGGREDGSRPRGVAPDMAAAIAARLGVELELVPFPHPDKLCAAAEEGAWDVALVGADPDRAQFISFTDAYCEIQATYMVRRDSPIRQVEDADRPGARIAVKRGGAYDLWLSRNLRHAELRRADTLDASYELFVGERLDALAGLRPKLLDDMGLAPGEHRLLDAPFMAVQQAVGCLRRADAPPPAGSGGDGEPDACARFLSDFVADAKASGLVQRLIDEHGVTGRLSVAPLAPPR